MDKRFEVEYDAPFPVSNDPEAETNAPHRKFFVVNGLKQCIKCKGWKPLDQFHKAKRLAFGTMPYCKECNRKRRMDYYYKKKEESPYRDEDGKLPVRPPLRRFKQKRAIPKRKKKKVYVKRVWMFIRSGHCLYDQMFDTEEAAKQYIQEKINDLQRIIDSSQKKREIARAKKEIDYWNSLEIGKYSIRKINVRNKEDEDE